MSDILDQPCTKCGETLRQALLSAMLHDLGCKSNSQPIECPGGGEHDWFVPHSNPENKEEDNGNSGSY